MAKLRQWDTAASGELYGIAGWGGGYFGINGKGNLVAFPRQNPRTAIDIRELVEDAAGRGFNLPLLIRFSDILHHRIDTLRRSFDDAMARRGYGGRYIGVYPIKVNPQRQVVEEIVRFGRERGMGLEAGSRPELHAVLAMQDDPRGIIICNGHKDEAYIRLALQAGRLGKRLFLVAEKPRELERILALAGEAGIPPRLGIRIKLVTSGSGKWEDSGGDRSKFGFTPSELMRAVELLRGQGCLDALRLIHFHLGSQISNIRAVKEALREMGRYYVELRRLGCPIDCIDLGGGLGVDYSGGRTADGFSINYTEQEYADDAVAALAGICSDAGLPHPDLITESGRALTAHHAMLAVNVLEISSLDIPPAPPLPGAEPHELIEKMQACLERLGKRNLHGSWQEAQFLRDEGSRLFDLGLFSLRQRARLEDSFWQVARRAERLMRKEQAPPAELEGLQTLLADKYFCNFSVFQSLPDSWAIAHEFPVMPLHRLGEKPARRGILQDITCDSDGKIASYIGAPEGSRVLPLHPLRNGEPYYLGIFLTGAYQEILGELHNLFGETNAVHVALNEDGSWRYEQMIHGENVGQVLSYVQFHRRGLEERIEKQVRESVAAGRITPGQGRAFRELYARGLDDLPYLESKAPGNSARHKGAGATTA